MIGFLFKTLLTWCQAQLARLRPKGKQSPTSQFSSPPMNAIANGERSVSVNQMWGGVILTGDISGIEPGPLVQQALGSSLVPALLTHTAFLRRLDTIAPTSYSDDLVGRDRELEQFRAYLTGACWVVLVLGPGGIGKTRLLLALPTVIPQDMRLWFVRKGVSAEATERAIALLDRHQRHLIVIDDALNAPSLQQFLTVLEDPDLSGQVKLVLSTRSVFRPQLLAKLPPLASEYLGIVDLGRLHDADIDTLLQSPAQSVADEETRHALVRIAAGNPFVASIAAQVIQRGEPLANLSREGVLARYLDQQMHDLSTVDAARAPQYMAFLEILSALGTIELRNEQLRERLQEVVGLTSAQLEPLIAGLVHAKIVDRSHAVLSFSSEIVSDYILFSHFFHAPTKQADYEQLVLLPFFSLKARDILTVLARAEVKGESEAQSLLGRLMELLQGLIDDQGLAWRLMVLIWVEEVAFVRPDDILALVRSLVEGQEPPPEAVQHPLLGPAQITHAQVLERAVALLTRISYQGDVRSLISLLHDLARYRPGEESYTLVREKARAALIALATIAPTKPDALFYALLDAIERWLEQDFLHEIDLCLALLGPMLRMDVEDTKVSPLQPTNITISSWVLPPSETLGTIRKRVFDILYRAYPRITLLSQRLALLRVLEGALPPVLPTLTLPGETRSWLQSDGVRAARFLAEDVFPGAELQVLDAIDSWLWRARRFSGYQAEEFDQLRELLVHHELYQLYRVLAGRMRRNEIEDILDYRAGEQYREQAVQRYLDALSPDTIDRVTSDLTAVAAQAQAVTSTDATWLGRLLEGIGKQYPQLANRLIELVMADATYQPLKPFLWCVLAGLTQSDPVTACTYRLAWVEADDVFVI